VPVVPPPPANPAPRVLILSAAIGEGHDLPARIVASDVADLAPAANVEIVDGLAVMGWPLNAVIVGGSPFHSKWGNRIFDVEYWLVTHFAPTRRLAGWFLYTLGGRRLMRLIEAERPDVIVSTYPGVTEVLGRLRRRGKLKVPAASAITDLAALRYWSHPGIDLHLVTHPESIEEVHAIAPGTRVVPVRGLNSPEFLLPRDRDDARRDLGFPSDAKIVVVSGGGWAVGDLAGSVEAVLELPDAMAVVLCGRNEEVRVGLQTHFQGDARVQVWGFTDRMSDLFTAADALVHSTAGLTVLEAHVRGCPTISYGWGRAHIRTNNQAFTRFGLAEVAPNRATLRAALGRALARRREPDLSFAELPSAAALVLELAAPDAAGELTGNQIADRA
jgi:processive 1,2-diacylglycerol beta-glucosyltransferase